MNATATLAPYLDNFLDTVTNLLGYEPTRSLVAYGITAQGPICAHRIPLHTEPVALDHLHYLSSQLTTRNCVAAILIAYSDEATAAHSLERAAFECEASGIEVLARFTVPGDHAQPQHAKGWS